MADEITQRYLDKQRVRGAPATIPGSTGMVGKYDCVEVSRQTMRGLCIDLGHSFELSDVRDARDKLAKAATAQRLRVLEAPLLVLNGDPMEDVPHEWDWKLVLPARGRVTASDGMTTERLHGGAYLETMTPRGFADLGNVYTYFLGHFLPSRSQQLTRPSIYHRITDGLNQDNPSKVSLTIFLPFYLSMKKPVERVTRELM